MLIAFFFLFEDVNVIHWPFDSNNEVRLIFCFKKLPKTTIRYLPIIKQRQDALINELFSIRLKRYWSGRHVHYVGCLATD